jgi:hypothetical protein
LATGFAWALLDALGAVFVGALADFFFMVFIIPINDVVGDGRHAVVIFEGRENIK